jgi:hypothetical protein
MKEQTDIQIKALSLKDNPETTRVACKSFIRQRPDNEIFHFFQFQNRGKGPPGRTRSPGKWDTMNPEPKLNAEKNYQCSPSVDGSIINFYKNH